MKRWLPAVISCLALAVSVVPQQARGQQAPALPPPVDRAASTEASAEVRDARAALARAKRVMASNWRMVEREYEGSEEYQLALNRMRVAQDDYNRMRKFVREHLEQEEAYVSAQRRRDEIQNKIRDLWKTEKWTMPRIQPLAEEALNQNVRLTRMEIIAIATEPALEGARQELYRAAEEVRVLRQAFREAVPLDPMVRAAQEEVAFQEERLAVARERLAEAERRERIEAAARAAVIREMQATGQLPGGG
ncbi:MAG: hypothetical protein ACFCVE_13145 [Phycisphaerae bacterium]